MSLLYGRTTCVPLDGRDGGLDCGLPADRSPLCFVAFQVLGSPSFPHRGELVLKLHFILFLHVLVLWTVIFWAGYETRACARFIETLSKVPNLWPDSAARSRGES